MRNGWDPEAFDRWLTTEPEPAHHATCTCWRCKEDPFAGLSDDGLNYSENFDANGDYFGKPAVGFGACETEDYPKYGAEEFS